MAQTGETDVTHVAFVLAPRFSMIAFAAAIEPMRLANRLSGREIYRWTLLSYDGDVAVCSNGSRMEVDDGLTDLSRGAIALLCAGIDAHLSAGKPVLTWLRRQSRLGVRLGALCTGAFILARGGLLDGASCTVHWENQAAMIEEFPDVEVTNRVYVIDEDIWTCAGGTASADMMIKIIARDHGEDLAAMVADQMILPPLRSRDQEQRMSVTARIGVRHPKLVTVVHMMEENIEEPISPPDLARAVGMSTRQLERLFRRYLNRSPKRYYMELRLSKARNLLLQTEMSVINVALACGFTSPSHFSKCYRSMFDTTPYRERGASASTSAPREA